MMNVLSRLQIFQSFQLQRAPQRPAPDVCRPCQPSTGCWSDRLQAIQSQECSQQFATAWASLVQPSAAPLPRPKEMGRNESAQVGPHTMQVDGGGNIAVNTAPAQLSVGGSCGSASFMANFSQQPQAPLKFSNGVVELPNGEKRPYGRTGCLVVMADGRQFGAGRSSANSNENIRYVTAEKGQEIPVSPPGATTVLYLDAQGNVEREEVR